MKRTQLLCILLLHVLFTSYGSGDLIVSKDDNELINSLKLMNKLEKLNMEAIEKDIFQEREVRDDDDLMDQPYETTVSNKNALADNEEVVFSVLTSTKVKNELLTLDSPVFHEMNMSGNLNTSTPAKNKTVTVECALRDLPEDEIPSVVVANNSILQSALVPINGTNITVADCAVALFFSSQCVFSARMAPHYNALARVFPGIPFYALDTAVHNGVHVRYGIVSVPNLLLFHNAKPVARFNETHVNLESLAGFITKYTNIQHNGTLNVTSADMSGPVPATLTKKIDYVLILAWVFTVFCCCFWFLKSSLCNRIVECIRNTWHEAEAQHEHTD